MPKVNLKQNLTRILDATKESFKNPPQHVIRETELESIRKIQTICNEEYKDQSFYGSAALNRKILLDQRIAELLTPDVLLSILYIQAGYAPQYQNSLILTRNTSETTIADAIYYGFHNGLEIIKVMPNNESVYGTAQYAQQQIKFNDATLNIATNLLEMADKRNIDLTQPQYIKENNGIERQPLSDQFKIIANTIKAIKENPNQEKKLLAVPGYSEENIRKQVIAGFQSLSEIIGLSVRPNSKPLTIDSTLENFAKKFIESDAAVLDGKVSHLFYDRAHLEAAIEQNTSIVFNGKEVTFTAILGEMIRQCENSPDSIAHEQFRLRLHLVADDLAARFPSYLNQNIYSAENSPLELSDIDIQLNRDIRPKSPISSAPTTTFDADTGSDPKKTSDIADVTNFIQSNADFFLAPFDEEKKFNQWAQNQSALLPLLEDMWNALHPVNADDRKLKTFQVSLTYLYHNIQNNNHLINFLQQNPDVVTMFKAHQNDKIIDTWYETQASEEQKNKRSLFQQSLANDPSVSVNNPTQNIAPKNPQPEETIHKDPEIMPNEEKLTEHSLAPDPSLVLKHQLSPSASSEEALSRVLQALQNVEAIKRALDEITKKLDLENNPEEKRELVVRAEGLANAAIASALEVEQLTQEAEKSIYEISNAIKNEATVKEEEDGKRIEELSLAADKAENAAEKEEGQLALTEQEKKEAEQALNEANKMVSEAIERMNSIEDQIPKVDEEIRIAEQTVELAQKALDEMVAAQQRTAEKSVLEDSANDQPQKLASDLESSQSEQLQNEEQAVTDLEKKDLEAARTTLAEATKNKMAKMDNKESLLTELKKAEQGKEKAASNATEAAKLVETSSESAEKASEIATKAKENAEKGQQEKEEKMAEVAKTQAETTDQLSKIEANKDTLDKVKNTTDIIMQQIQTTQSSIDQIKGSLQPTPPLPPIPPTPATPGHPSPTSQDMGDKNKKLHQEAMAIKDEFRNMKKQLMNGGISGVKKIFTAVENDFNKLQSLFTLSLSSIQMTTTPQIDKAIKALETLKDKISAKISDPIMKKDFDALCEKASGNLKARENLMPSFNMHYTVFEYNNESEFTKESKKIKEKLAPSSPTGTEVLADLSQHASPAPTSLIDATHARMGEIEGAIILEHVDERNSVRSEVTHLPKDLNPLDLWRATLQALNPKISPAEAEEYFNKINQIAKNNKRDITKQDIQQGLACDSGTAKRIFNFYNESFQKAMYSDTKWGGEKFPSDKLINIAMQQVEGHRQKEQGPIIISKAFSAAYVEAIMLYCKDHNYEVINKSAYKEVDKKITEKRADLFGGLIERNKQRFSYDNIRLHRESVKDLALEGNTIRNRA